MATTVKCRRPYLRKSWLVLHPAKVVLETLVVAVTAVLVGMTTSVMEETAVIKATLAEDVVVVDMVVVGMAMMDLTMTEAILEVEGSIVILAITTSNSGPMKGET